APGAGVLAPGAGQIGKLKKLLRVVAPGAGQVAPGAEPGAEAGAWRGSAALYKGNSFSCTRFGFLEGKAL
ncbi:hypothetical protein A2U01_0057896, partial [Trifolium medium]|nr:hypothetical protein [Trifolium medium]